MMSVDRLRAMADGHTLFSASSLKRAIHQLGFVQADPIRAPARAQDLILRHRAPDYRVGDLELQYAQLEIEEDYLYAYGFLPSSTSRLLRPRANAKRATAADRKVLKLVQALGVVHPRDLDAHLGKKRVVNAWGGFSQASKRSLERLHHLGLLRVEGRRAGVRLYSAVPERSEAIAPARRFRELLLTISSVLAPVPAATLQRMASLLRRWIPEVRDHRQAIAELLREGVLESDDCDGVRYLWPASLREAERQAPRVRLLAPFDPLVWDRTRFEQLWGWSYRFEAYTPLSKRIRGYYALPLAWNDAVIGWANVARRRDGGLEVETGFAHKRPRERAFARELEAEVERLRTFLNGRERLG